MATSEELLAKLEAEAVDCYGWSNGPGDRYAPHSHPYRKVLYCVSGSITFRLEATGEDLTLTPGERIVIEPGVSHSALVGASGVRCLEGKARPAGEGPRSGGSGVERPEAPGSITPE